MLTYFAVAVFFLGAIGMFMRIADATRTQPAPAAVASKPPVPTAVPLKEWRGVGRMTRKDTVSCSCGTCGSDWKLDSRVSNALANEQGMGGRLQRAGLGMEQTGAKLTPGASGRRMAAGNELHRANEFIANLHTLAACPSCNSVDILLTK